MLKKKNNEEDSFGNSISKKIQAFQNQIQETNEINKREQAIQKDLSSRSLKSWEQKSNQVQSNIKREQECNIKLEQECKIEQEREQEQEEEQETIQIIPTKIENPPEIVETNESGKPSEQV